MKKFSRISTLIPDVVMIELHPFLDSRGFFLESYNREELEQIGVPDLFVQDNHSCSRKGVVRGLHFQSRYPQGKLVRVLRGKIFDVVVDLRKQSPYYGNSICMTLSEEKPQMLWVPVGFAHGFLALEDRTEVLYKTTERYHPEFDAGIRWNDPDLGIAWPFMEHDILEPLVSEKDSQLPRLKEISSPFVYGGPGR